MSHTIDCIIPVHRKDVPRLPACVQGLRRCVPEVGRILLVGNDADRTALDEAISTMREPGECRFVSEDAFMRAPSAAAGSRPRAREWLLQQRIKLEGHRLVDTDHYLVVDADVVFVNETRLFDDRGRVTMAYDAPRRRFASHPLSGPCHAFRSVAEHLLGIETPLHDVCYICHHMVFRAAYVKEMLDSVGKDWSDAIDRVIPITEVWSEFDLYMYFLARHHPESFVHREAPWLDVPWTGASGAVRDAYLEIFREAGVSFVALHHHFEEGLSIDECVAFARETCAALPDEHIRGRWPLARWLTRRDACRTEAARPEDEPTCDQVLGLIEQVILSSLTSIVIRYAHVRDGETFAIAARAHEPRALADLRVDTLELNTAVSIVADVMLAPLVAIAVPDEAARAFALQAIGGTKAALDRIGLLLSAGSAAHPVDPHALAQAVDAGRLAFAGLARINIDFAGHAEAIERIPWRDVDTDRWISLTGFVARHSADTVVLARWLARVLTTEQWAAVRPHLASGQLLAERLGDVPPVDAPQLTSVHGG